ncbi:hypothetical protein M9458_018997, partial [Cirrhinus mrigala]
RRSMSCDGAWRAGWPNWRQMCNTYRGSWRDIRCSCVRPTATRAEPSVNCQNKTIDCWSSSAG